MQDFIQIIENIEKQVKIKQLQEFYKEDRILLSEAKELIAYLYGQNKIIAEALKHSMSVAKQRQQELEELQQQKSIYVYHNKVT